MPKDIINILELLGKADNIPFNQLYNLAEDCADRYYTKVIKTLTHLLKSSFHDRQLVLVNTTQALKFWESYTARQTKLWKVLSKFITTNMSNSGISSAKANSISRTLPPLFTIKIPKEKQIVEDLQEIESMQLVVQVIMVIVCIIIAFIVLYYCCKMLRHMRTLFKHCFPFLPILRILRTSCRTDLFIEVTNVTKGNTVWAHFTATGYFPTNIHLSRPIPKESVRTETRCCIFKQMIIDWTNTEVTGISGIRIEMPNEAKILIFTDNDLTHITDDHFEISLVA